MFRGGRLGDEHRGDSRQRTSPDASDDTRDDDEVARLGRSLQRTTDQSEERADEQSVERFSKRSRMSPTVWITLTR